MKKTILLMDNNEDFLEVQAELLEQDGYHTLQATSIREAKEKLRDHYIHLAIVDVRMVDDGDRDDFSGLEIVRDPAYETIPKIILTAYLSWQATETAFDKQLVDMVNKKDGPEAINEKVQKAFAKSVTVNWDLKIRWSDTFSLPHLASILTLPNDVPLSRAIQELEELFRRLFLDSYYINIGDKLFCKGNGKVYLPVFTHAKQGVERPFLVALGLQTIINDEAKKFQDLVPFNGSNASLQQLNNRAATVHYEATIYQLPNTDIDSLVSFKQFYKIKATEDIIHALDLLFNQTLASWYSADPFELVGYEPKKLPLVELTESKFQAELNQKIEKLCAELLRVDLVHIRCKSKELEIFLEKKSKPIRLPHPAALGKSLFTFSDPLICATSHGRLGGETIWLDAAGGSRLLDFSAVERGPILFDFIALETAVKFDLLDSLTPLAYYELEAELLGFALPNGATQDTHNCPQVEKAISTIVQIREAAADYCEEGSQLHYIALYTTAFKRLATYDATVLHRKPELVPFLRALLSCAMLAQQIQAHQETSNEGKAPLRLDEQTRHVWRGEERINLTPREYGLFYYLYQHKNETCLRQDVAKAVFPDEYAENTPNWVKKALNDGRINTNISRLRHKLEGGTGVKYLYLERGVGYRLEP